MWISLDCVAAWDGVDGQGLAEPLTSCCILETGSCMLPGQHNRDGPGGRGVDELAPEEGISTGKLVLPLPFCEVAWAKERCFSHPLSMPHHLQQKGGLSEGHESRRAGPAPWLGNTVELALVQRVQVSLS